MFFLGFCSGGCFALLSWRQWFVHFFVSLFLGDAVKKGVPLEISFMGVL